MFGSPDFTAVIVLLGLFGAVLLALLSYQRPGRGYITLGWGLLVLATSVALLLGAFGTPGLGPAVVLLIVLLATMALLMTYQNRAWAHAVFWIGVLLFVLALPFLTANRGDLALFCLIAGPGLLMLVATLFPEVPASYSRLGVTDAPEDLTPDELATERAALHPPGHRDHPGLDRRGVALRGRAPGPGGHGAGPAGHLRSRRWRPAGRCCSRSSAARPATASTGRRRSAPRCRTSTTTPCA